jgi:hypothetical protein
MLTNSYLFQENNMFFNNKNRSEIFPDLTAAQFNQLLDKYREEFPKDNYGAPQSKDKAATIVSGLAASSLQQILQNPESTFVQGLLNNEQDCLEKLCALLQHGSELMLEPEYYESGMKLFNELSPNFNRQSAFYKLLYLLEMGKQYFPVESQFKHRSYFRLADDLSKLEHNDITRLHTQVVDDLREMRKQHRLSQPEII